MDKRVSIAAPLAELNEMSPTGFAIALHVQFSTPVFLFQTYPKDWSDHYTSHGLVLHDPAVRWGFNNTGTIRWRDQAEDDPAGVIEQARQHGLKYGISVALNQQGSRSIAAFSRGDRDFLDIEIDEIRDRVEILHRETAGIETLPPDVVQALKDMSIRLTHN